MPQTKTQRRNVLNGGQIKFQGDRWTAPGLEQHVRQQATIRFPADVNFCDPLILDGPVVEVGGKTFALTRICPPPLTADDRLDLLAALKDAATEAVMGAPPGAKAVSTMDHIRETVRGLDP